MTMRTAAWISLAICVLLSLNGAVAQTATPQIVSAAKAFISTLDQKQKAGVVFAFDDQKQRAHWSNLPNSMVHRSGLSMGELSAAQRSAAMALVSAALSRRGFE